MEPVRLDRKHVSQSGRNIRLRKGVATPHYYFAPCRLRDGLRVSPCDCCHIGKPHRRIVFTISILPPTDDRAVASEHEVVDSSSCNLNYVRGTWWDYGLTVIGLSPSDHAPVAPK